MDKETLQKIEQTIGYEFSDKKLLAKAFTHSSAVDNRVLSNERLEFLGDSILAVVICQTLFERFPNYLEGDLTKIKSMIVSRGTCSKVSRKLGLQKYLKVGKGMVSSRALSGSLIDGGLEAAQSFIMKVFGSIIDTADAQQAQGNFKSLLQQYAQEKFNVTPVYILLDEKGPDHNKCFELGVVIDSHHFPSAWGTNKKEAEQKAAFNALVELGVLEKSSEDDDE
jgi:ribonuclease-3